MWIRASAQSMSSPFIQIFSVPSTSRILTVEHEITRLRPRQTDEIGGHDRQQMAL
jgi:hypothetical protein